MTQQNQGLSIQITLGGFSFQIESQYEQTCGALSCYDLDSVLKGRYSLDTTVEWSVPSVLIVPYDLFDHSSIDHYLIASAMIEQSSQRSMFAVKGEYVAVWAVDSELYDYIYSRIPDAEHTHSLLKMIDRGGDPITTIALDMDATSLLHIAVWSEYGLEAAHSIEVGSIEDILFYARRLSPSDTQINYRILVFEGLPTEAVILLGRYYPLVERV